MRRIGTVTIAVSLMYFGIMLLVRQYDTNLGNSVFRFWPAIIILLGLEILYYINKYGKEEKLRFNFFIILIVILFMSVDGIFTLGNFIKSNKGNWNFNGIKFSGINFGNHKTIDVNNLEFKKEKQLIIIEGNNANLKLKKSPDDKIRLQGKVQVGENNSDNLDLKAEIEGETQVLDFIGGDIQSFEGTLYIPENMGIEINVNNMTLENEDEFKTSDIKVDSNNGTYSLNGFKSVSIDNNNGTIDIKNSNTVKVKTNNAKISLDGDVENIEVKSNLSAVNVDNNICKNVNIESDAGTIKLKTKEKNFKLNAKSDVGVINVDGNKETMGKFSTTFGSGEGNVNLNSGAGTIRVTFKEW